MPARERESGELPFPNLSSFDRKVGRGLFVLEKRLALTEQLKKITETI
jgi:hypothetical protein